MGSKACDIVIDLRNLANAAAIRENPDGVSRQVRRMSAKMAIDAIAPPHGLSSTEAAARLKAEGPNLLPQPVGRSLLKIIGEVLREPMLALLLIGGFAYLLLGDLMEALILLALAALSVVITVVQESRTEHVLEALRDLSAPRALVIRDGEQLRIAGCDVVRGDVILIGQGDRVAADATLCEARELEVDESLLTGESMPVAKCAMDGGTSPPAPPDGKDQFFVYAGSIVTRGHGVALVTAIGAKSVMGKIGKSLATLDPEVPRLRLEATRIIRIAAVGGALIALAVAMLYGLTRGGWLDAVLVAIATGMAMLPEEIPVVLTVFLAAGAWRISKAQVLTRRAAAIETLGSTTVLCTDKTGTLTENHMAVVRLWRPDDGMSEHDGAAMISDSFAELITAARFASPVQAIDPMEVAIHNAGAATGLVQNGNWELVHSYGLQPDLLAMSNVWRTPDKLLIAAKGAPEAIATLCRLHNAKARAMLDAADAMAEQGIRVLGVACADSEDGKPALSHRAYNFRLIGLVGLADPLRPGVPRAVAECQAAGVRIIMITGDYAKTACAIARQAGIPDDGVLSGAELEALGEEALTERLRNVTVCARIMPQQKLRIVEALKAAGEMVAMTGDGVNDAPSLKAAHIGIAMGKRGTDVAREAASIVLLDDDFGSIVKAIALGRRIYGNIGKAMIFIFAVHVPIAGFAILPLLLGMPILFTPIHIALLEMVIDPVCAFVFEAEEADPDTMQRPPRPPDARLFSWGMIGWSLLQGGFAFTLLAGLYAWGNSQALDLAHMRALLFFALIASIVALVLADRSATPALTATFRQRNVALAIVLSAVVTISAIIMLAPAVTGLLRFSALHWLDWMLVAGTAITLFALSQLCKTLVLHPFRTG
jgi:Ca2+-transporting ATPase